MVWVLVLLKRDFVNGLVCLFIIFFLEMCWNLILFGINVFISVFFIIEMVWWMFDFEIFNSVDSILLDRLYFILRRKILRLVLILWVDVFFIFLFIVDSRLLKEILFILVRLIYFWLFNVFGLLKFIFFFLFSRVIFFRYISILIIDVLLSVDVFENEEIFFSVFLVNFLLGRWCV